MNTRSYIFIFALIAVCLFANAGFAAPAAGKPPFDDIAGSYAEDAIAALYAKRIVGGVGDRRFAPERAVTRAEFAAMMLRALHLNPVGNAIPAFSDVRRDAWYYGDVHGAVNLGIVGGTGPRTFEPGRPVTRQEAAVIAARALRLHREASGRTGLSYADAERIASWAASSVAATAEAGLMQGYAGKFRPLRTISRAEAAVLLYRIVEMPGWKAQFAAEPDAGVQLGWLYEDADRQFRNMTINAVVNTISPRWFFITATGGTTGQADPALIALAHERGKRVWPLVGNRFDREMTHLVLTDPKRSETLVRRLADIVQTYRLDGLNLDFENVDPADRDAFSSFVRETARALHVHGAELSVCVPPDLETDWSEPFDYAALAAAADYIVLMGYEEHWNGSPEPGSVSSLPWVERHVRKLVRQIPAGQVILGLPFYTRDWSRQNGRTVSEDLTLAEQNRRLAEEKPAVRWDETLGQYTAVYNRGGTKHSIWAEDSRSLSLKYMAGASFGIGGNAYWHIGGESPDVWASLGNAIRYGGYDFTRRTVALR
ncbi:S-layer homology domain-containing protein [Paenibacillus cisolokensis]|uniref:S-layer homology domain-containing protein n=1 Tax=Paenibacillus cisolokensis TaxID=1658519 RepID=UPI003D2AD93C